MINSKLAIPKNIQDLCEERNRVLSHYKTICEILETDKISLGQYGEFLYPHIPIIGIKAFREELDRCLWRNSLDRAGLYQYMDAEALSKLNQDLEQNIPEFTLENINATLLTAVQTADEMFIRGMVNIFRGLSRAHKTNTNEPFKVNDRAITRGADENYAGGIRIHYYHEDKINDLDRIFKVLDRAEFKPRQLISSINNAFKIRPYIFEDEYFIIKGYKNGNLHIKFKRRDLLDKANHLIAKYYGKAFVS